MGADQGLRIGKVDATQDGKAIAKEMGVSGCVLIWGGLCLSVQGGEGSLLSLFLFV